MMQASLKQLVYILQGDAFLKLKINAPGIVNKMHKTN
jgi:hypothetical protein